MNLQVLYEDNHIIAVYKPAGLLVQGDITGDKSLMDEVKEYLKEKYKKPGNVFLGLVHRLDRPVSGIVLFGKTSKGASRLSEQFRNHEIKKIYKAILEGKINESGQLVHFIKKDEDKVIARIKDEDDSEYQKAELDYKLVKSGKNFSLVEINLKTGRFNQIRAQFSAIGHPVVGDKKYGADSKMLDGSIALYAVEIEFKTATTGEIKNIKIDYPKSWEDYFK